MAGRRYEQAQDPHPDRVRVIVAHAGERERRALRRALGGSTHVAVVASAREAVEAVELTRFYAPDLVIVDAALPRRGGIATVRQLAATTRAATIVVCETGDDPVTGLAALRAGASGFVADLATLAGAVGVVVEGGAALSPRLAAYLVDALREATAGGGMRPVRSALTGREWEVLDLLCAGRSTREIAEALYLTDDTVYGHVKRILRKLGVKSRAEAVMAADALRTALRA